MRRPAGTCPECRWSFEREGMLRCDVPIPANLAAALGLDSPFDVPDARTSPKWSCPLFTPEE